MSARRLTALLLALFTMHLNLLGADFACARHGAAGSAMSERMAAHQPMPATNNTHGHSANQSATPGVAAVSDNGQDHPPCEVPVQSNCCRALASCSVFYSAQSELQVANAPNFRELIALRAMTTPPSETAAPEPPPPKV